MSKKRCNSREESAPPPLKKIKKEQEDDYFPSCSNKSSRNESVVHLSNEEHKLLKEDFNWTSILHQDIEIEGIKIKTGFIRWIRFIKFSAIRYNEFAI